MATFWRMAPDPEPGELWVEDMEVPESYEGYHLGEPIDPPEPPARFVYTDCGARKPDLLAGVHLGPVVSGRFAELLREAEGEHVQLHPVEVACGREVDRSYSFLVVLHNLPALDRERSRVRTLPDFDVIVGIESLALREDAVGDRALFRLAEAPVPLLVRDDLRKRIEAAGLTGMRFASLDEPI